MDGHVFVVGADEHNLAILERMDFRGDFAFHSLLTFDDIYTGDIVFSGLLARAYSILDGFDGPIAAIIGFWDFPVTTMLPLLRRHAGLPAVPITDILKCEHKYWSRLVQQTVIDEYPRFGLVNPGDDAEIPAHLNYPVWVKPVKSFHSMLAFRAADRNEFEDALAKIRAGAGWVTTPFNAVLDHVDLPPEVASVNAGACLVEEALTGHQVTLEGYRYRGDVVIYGAIDSVCGPDGPSFLRFQYPSSLPAPVIESMTGIARRVVEAIGLDGTTFNIEFFYDPGTGRVRLLEINPRHSQSHAELFERVDGNPNHQVMLDLALGRDPKPPHGWGAYAVAAKCFVRRYRDGVVRAHPSDESIARIEREVPATTVELDVLAGDRLSALHRQDSYSFQLASVHVGAVDEADLFAKCDAVVNSLTFDIDDIDEPPIAYQLNDAVAE